MVAMVPPPSRRSNRSERLFPRRVRKITDGAAERGENGKPRTVDQLADVRGQEHLFVRHLHRAAVADVIDEQRSRVPRIEERKTRRRLHAGDGRVLGQIDLLHREKVGRVEARDDLGFVGPLRLARKLERRKLVVREQNRTMAPVVERCLCLIRDYLVDQERRFVARGRGQPAQRHIAHPVARDLILRVEVRVPFIRREREQCVLGEIQVGRNKIGLTTCVIQEILGRVAEQEHIREAVVAVGVHVIVVEIPQVIANSHRVRHAAREVVVHLVGGDDLHDWICVQRQVPGAVAA
jgi:hypothetical protein